MLLFQAKLLNGYITIKIGGIRPGGAVDKNKYYEIESLLMFDTLCNKSVNELSTKKEERKNKENNTF